jgi:hypothetical protein
MSSDFITELLKKTHSEYVEKLYNKGLAKEEIDKLLEDFDLAEPFEAGINASVKSHVEYFEKHMFERVLEERAQYSEFFARNDQIWGKGFIASEAMYILSVEASEMYGEYLQALDDPRKEETKFTYITLQHIHGRACQIFLEVLYLMKSGFADGAYARWRSMYELSVIADFIKNYGESVAEAFIESSDSEERWYNWAKKAECFNNVKGNITFEMLQKQCDFVTDDWRKQHDLANKLVHGSPQGTFKRLGVYKESGAICAGHTDYGMSTPAEHSAISLSIITGLLLTVIPYGDGIVYTRTLREWVEVVRKHYFSAKKNCFTAENKTRFTKIDGSAGGDNGTNL